MNFFPQSSFEIPRQQNGLIAADKHSRAEFWNLVDAATDPDISGGIGCYIFSIRAGRGALPWYVGMAEKQSFRDECFTSHKINHYNNAIVGRKGTPLLTLVSKYTPGNKIVSPNGSEHRDIQFLETMLISSALRRNPELSNKQDTKFLRDMIVHGLINTPKGKAFGSVNEFRQLIGIGE